MPALVVSTARLNPVCEEWLAKRVELVEWHGEDRQGLYRLLSEAEGLVIATYLRINSELLAAAPRLRVVGRAGVGLEHVDLGECRRRQVQVVHTPVANRQAVVEYVLGLILDALRPRTLIDSTVTADDFHRYRRTEVGRQLDQLTLGILGFGGIGKRLGEIAHAIGMQLIVSDLLPETQLRDEVDFPFEYVEARELYQRSDVLSVHVDGRAENRHLISAPELKWLRPDCLFINASRGMVVDSAALAEWAGRTCSTGGQAVLDVLDPEPPESDCPLFGLPNVRVLPHIAARTHTALENMSWVVRDVWAVLQGKAPDFSAY